MCDCKQMVRDWERERYDQGNNLPLSDHHPACEDYKLYLFAKIYHEGSSVLVTKFSEVTPIINEYVAAGESIHGFQVYSITMTSDQYEKLKDFQGV